MESNEDTFKPDVVIESFHHQARVPISDRALLACFLMVWLKWCVVPTLPHKVIIADVVYLIVLLAHGRSIALLSTMASCIQSGLRVQTRSLCHVETFMDKEGNPLMDQNGKPQFKTPNLRVELLYTYLMAWHVMHCPWLMTAVSASEGFVPFVQMLENSNWIHYYICFSSGELFWVDQTTSLPGASLIFIKRLMGINSWLRRSGRIQHFDFWDLLVVN